MKKIECIICKRKIRSGLKVWASRNNSGKMNFSHLQCHYNFESEVQNYAQFCRSQE